MAFKAEIIFDPDRDTPTKVTEEIDDKLVPDLEVGNDSYIHWDSDTMGEDYPNINKYLLSHDIVDCLIKISW